MSGLTFRISIAALLREAQLIANGLDDALGVPVVAAPPSSTSPYATPPSARAWKAA